MTDRSKTINTDKDKFPATVSHELRAPLNMVIAYLNLINSNRHLPSQASREIKHALNSSSLVLAAVNDLLDYHQINHGQLAFAPQNVQLKQVIFEAHAALALKASEHKLLYAIDLDETLPTWAHVDPNRLTQIIFNLLINAIQFTPNGFVELRADHERMNESGGILHLRVTDSGVGIPFESQASIFEPFVQLDTVAQTTQPNSQRGNGLGLSIVESLVRGWGGSIQLFSKPGEGTCLDVWLPLEKVGSKNDAPEPTGTHFAHPVLNDVLQILIVDDHALHRMVAAATIHQHMPKVVIDEAQNGSEALKKMATHTYDVVLMALTLPDMMGTALLRRIRKELSPAHHPVRVIALTTNLSDADQKECQDIGITEMLPKPLHRDVLIQTLRNHPF